MAITFFRTPADLRKWFRKNHDTAQELWVGFYKVGSGKPSITWPESVHEALCVGWVDGIRKTIDDESYKIRFTPRKKISTWSAVNIRRVKVLTDEKRMQPAGLKAFEARRENRSGIYAYEQRPREFDEPYLGLMKKDRGPWPASLVATSRRRLGVRARTDTRRSEAGGSARLERRDSAAGKTVPERSPSASAPIRLRGPLGPVAEPMLYRRSSHPSRRRIVRSGAEGPFSHGAKWSAEPPASLRRAPAGADA